MIHFQRRQRLVRHGLGDDPPGPYLGKVTHPAQEAVGDPRRPSGAFGDLRCPGILNGDAQNARAAGNDLGQLRRGI